MTVFRLKTPIRMTTCIADLPREIILETLDLDVLPDDAPPQEMSFVLNCARGLVRDDGAPAPFDELAQYDLAAGLQKSMRRAFADARLREARSAHSREMADV